MFVSHLNDPHAQINKEWMARDINALWHPCTQMKDHEHYPLIPVRRGEGLWLEDMAGQRYMDAISSWWVNILGHANPRINAKLREQMDQLEHVILSGFTHEPVIQLSEKLGRITPEGLGHCFYGDNGSAAIEIALKMSLHYWRNIGRPEKHRFLTLSNGYHGETVGALSVSDLGLYAAPYESLLFDVLKVPSPDCFGIPREQWDAHASKMFAHMERMVAQHAHELAAVILEPLVQCAGGMRMYPPSYLTRLRALCDHYDVQLIVDEIAVGFGRTGTLFACEQADIRPDYLCLSKALTGGYLPLSVVLTTDQIYNAFYDDYTTMKAFLHSHSYTGNALACSAALATLEILEEDNVIERNQQRAHHLGKAAEAFQAHPHVGDVRQTGMIVAIEMVQDKASLTPYPFEERRGMRAYETALAHGVLLRPLGNVLYWMPPYIINDAEIERLAEVTALALDAATA